MNSPAPFSRRRLLVLVVAGALLGLAGALFWATPRDPVHEGRRLSQWVALLDTGPPDKALLAEEAIRELGPLAVPWLLGELQGSDSGPGIRFLRWANRHSSLDLPYQSAGLRRYRALRAIEVLGQRAAPAIPQLQKLRNSDSPALRQAAQDALEKIAAAEPPKTR